MVLEVRRMKSSYHRRSQDPNQLLDLPSLLLDLPLTVDPYQYLSELLLQFTSPEASQFAYSVTLGFGVLFGIIILICGFMLAYPFVEKSGSRGKNFWLVRKCHAEHSAAKQPYLVLNGGISLAICQLLGSIIFEIFIVLSVLAHRHPDRNYAPYQAFCQIVMWLPGFCGFLASAFSASYVCISTSNQERPSFFLRPIVYNSLLFIIPVYATIQAIGWAIAGFVIVSKQIETFSTLLQTLSESSQNWQKIHLITPHDIKSVSQAYAQTTNYAHTRFCIRRGSTLSWLPISFGLLCFYLYTVFSLFCLIRDLDRNLRNKEDKFTLLSILPQFTMPANTTLTATQRDYRLLLWHCVFMSFCLIYNTSVGFWFLFSDQSNWHSSGEPISLGGGFFLSIGMIFQSRLVIAQGQNQVGDPEREKRLNSS